MPFGEFQDFDDCVAKNQDKDDPKAWCAALERAIKAKMGEAVVRLSRAQIERACPRCASEMKRRGMSALKLDEAALQNLPLSLARTLLSEVEDPGFFRHCMDEIAPQTNVSDPEAFCAWLHQTLTGIWPGEHREARARPGAFQEGGPPRSTELWETFERGDALREAEVDRAGRTIRNVKLLGKVSRNGRTYSDQALNDAVRLYPHAPFYLDHPTDKELRERNGLRSVLDLAGEVLNPRRVGEAVRGDLHVLDREPVSTLLFALAEQMPHMAGNSHRARGLVRPTERGDVVESLTEVYAVELVTDPATATGLFESVTQEEEEMDFTKLTAADLKGQRPDLVKALLAEVTEGTELERLKKRNQELEAAQAKQARAELITKKLGEAKLPEALVTAAFQEQLVAAKDEAAIDALLAERKELATKLRPVSGVRSYERDPDARRPGPKDGKAPAPVEEAKLTEYARRLGVQLAAR